MPIDQIRAKLDQLPAKAFDKLTQLEQRELAETLRPPKGTRFSPEQKELLKDRWLVAAISAEDIDALNQARLEQGLNHLIPYRVANNGRVSVPAKLLTWIREGEGYQWIAELLRGWPIAKITRNEFPTESEP